MNVPGAGVAGGVRRRAVDRRRAEREQRPRRRGALHLRVRIDVVGGGDRVVDARAAPAGRDGGHDPRQLQHRRRRVADLDGERRRRRLVAVPVDGDARDQRLAEREERPGRVIADDRAPVRRRCRWRRSLKLTIAPRAGVGADLDVGQQARGRAASCRPRCTVNGRLAVWFESIGHRAHDRRDLVEQEEVRRRRRAFEQQVLVDRRRRRSRRLAVQRPGPQAGPPRRDVGGT